MQHTYGLFGFEFSLELSTRPENYLGEITTWDAAEAVRDGRVERQTGGALQSSLIVTGSKDLSRKVSALCKYRGNAAEQSNE